MTQLTRSTAAVLTAGLLLALPLSATAAKVPTSATTTESDDDAQLLLLMDASGSMADPDAAGEPKIEAARTALSTVIDGLNPDQSVGLRVFGGEVPIDQPTEAKCTDSQLVVPIGSGNSVDLQAAVEDYEPTGETPIGYALQQAATDLGPEGNRTVLLVSDGIATCDPDPCQVAEQLSADGLDLVVHTVGLGADDATRSQLQCIADAAGGTYYDAQDTDTLTSALTRISTRAFRPFTIQGTPVQGQTDPDSAPEVAVGGQYTDTFGVPEQPKYYTVTRSSPGTAIHVGLSAQPPLGPTAMGQLELETLDGQQCASRRFSSGTDITNTSILSGAVHTVQPDPGTELDDECLTAPVLRLSVMVVGNYRATEGVPLEMVVQELPALADAPIPEVGSLPGWTPMEASEPQEVTPGTSFNDAAPVTPGTSYDVDIMPGEVLFFTLPATFGQAVQMRVDSDPARMSQTQIDALGRYGELLVRNVYTPQRAEILNLLGGADGIGGLDGDRNMIVRPDRPEAGATSSGQIRFSNRNTVSGPFTEGDYYFTLAYRPSRSDVPVPLTLTFDVVGDAVPGPHSLQGDARPEGAQDKDVSTADVTDTATDADPDDTGAATVPEDAVAGENEGPVASGTTDDGSGMPWAWLLGGAGVVLAGAGAGLLATRHRSSTR